MSSNAISIQQLSFSYPEYPGLPAKPLFSGLALDLEDGAAGWVLGPP